MINKFIYKHFGWKKLNLKNDLKEFPNWINTNNFLSDSIYFIKGNHRIWKIKTSKIRSVLTNGKKSKVFDIEYYYKIRKLK